MQQHKTLPRGKWQMSAGGLWSETRFKFKKQLLLVLFSFHSLKSLRSHLTCFQNEKQHHIILQGKMPILITVSSDL